MRFSLDLASVVEVKYNQKLAALIEIGSLDTSQSENEPRSRDVGFLGRVILLANITLVERSSKLLQSIRRVVHMLLLRMLMMF